MRHGFSFSAPNTLHLGPFFARPTTTYCPCYNPIILCADRVRDSRIHRTYRSLRRTRFRVLERGKRAGCSMREHARLTPCKQANSRYSLVPSATAIHSYSGRSWTVTRKALVGRAREVIDIFASTINIRLHFGTHCM